jgi:1,4-dihydroxy-2-naphthoate octaprenyltransferase
MSDKGGPANSIKGFFVLSRLPFLSPGIAAFVAGVFVAVGDGFDPNLGLVGMSVTGLAMIMLTTYYFNEYYDFEGDVINRTFIKFSGGSRAIPDKMVSRKVAKAAGLASIAVLVVFAIVYLLVYFRDYPLLLPLGLFGAFCGVFYSHPPFQWAYQGIGEVMIGGCYGVLSLASGYYVSSAVLEPATALIAIPASLTVFGVIVANEFPDYEADNAVNKRNVIVRLGPERGQYVFIAAMALAYPFMLASIIVGVSPMIAVVGLPVLLCCAIAIKETLGGGYARHDSQIKISGATLFANLLSSLLFVPVVLIW